ncbi:hypothetical protein L6452_36349 [Arctium lappa]|uniref:Uncharacterized protein n=1 Tax=Arctium lappa TaxID=4217 RepID=A0ACB8Y9M6_ARCLA|nr:hypothetical protein L6452_36349 [Arctium lappa]
MASILATEAKEHEHVEEFTLQRWQDEVSLLCFVQTLKSIPEMVKLGLKFFNRLFEVDGVLSEGPERVVLKV